MELYAFLYGLPFVANIVIVHEKSRITLTTEQEKVKCLAINVLIPVEFLLF